jgi:hypothetical protein
MSDLGELIDLLREAHEQQRTVFKDAPTLYSRAADALERFQNLDSEAATHVESVIVMRTHFTGEPPYVGWKGLGLALNEALDERDRALSRYRWVPVSERLPEAGELVMVYSPPTKDSWPDEMNVGFDCIDPDVDDPGPYAWLNHNNHYEHYCAVACEGMTGPREQAPYTHWMPLPPAPESD